MTLELFRPVSEPAAPSSRLPSYHSRVRWACGRALSRVSCAMADTWLGRRLHARILAGIELVTADVELPGPAARIEWPRIAFLSDLHVGHYLTAEDLERLAGLLMALSPDLVCLGGDLINHFDEELVLLEPMLARLSAAPLGVHAVPGNHDYVELGEIDGWTRHLEARGVNVLHNRGARIEHRGASFWLCGVDDLTLGEPCLEDALAGRRAEEPTLLLSHHPDVFLEASARGVDLQLSGHTHGGQIRVLGVAPLNHSRFGWVEGVHARGAARLYVGRGAGVTALPLRIATRGEITLLQPRAAG